MRIGERYAVVSANGQGQAEFLEHALEYGEGVDFLGARQCLAAQQVAVGKVGEGERVAIAPIGEHELALVVGAPQLVGTQGLGQGGALGLEASSTAAVHQPV